MFLISHPKFQLQVNSETYEVIHLEGSDVEAIKEYYLENNITKGEDLIPDRLKEARRKDIQRADLGETLVKLIKMFQKIDRWEQPD